MRCGASNSTCVSARSATASKACARSPPLAGRKPTKTKPCPTTSPATHTAASALLAPGKGMQRRPAALTAATKAAPGSLTAGVPASLT